MQPITYENQCRACHPVHVESPANGSDPALALTIRHGLQPAELHADISQSIAARALAGASELLDKPAQVPMPGRETEDQMRTKKVRDEVANRVARIEHILFTGAQTCYECHHYAQEPKPQFACREPSDPPPPVVITPGEPPKLDTGQGEPVALHVVAPRVPQIWYEHARFDHTAHRAMSCLACHAGAYPEAQGGTASCTSRDVLLPGLENCQTCHAPASHSGGKRRGGVAFACTECHRYHNGDSPHQGLGAAARGVKAGERMTAEQWLLAAPPGRTNDDPSTSEASKGK